MTLPDAFQRLEAHQPGHWLDLANLRLTDSDLRALLPELQKLELSGLGLSGNRLSSLPEPFCELGTLQALQLDEVDSSS